jgi:hypothetical protein
MTVGVNVCPNCGANIAVKAAEPKLPEPESPPVIEPKTRRQAQIDAEYQPPRERPHYSTAAYPHSKPRAPSFWLADFWSNALLVLGLLEILGVTCYALMIDMPSSDIPAELRVELTRAMQHYRAAIIACGVISGLITSGFGIMIGLLRQIALNTHRS